MSGFEDKARTARIEGLKAKGLGHAFPHHSVCSAGPGRPENKAETARIEAEKRRGPGAL